MKKKRRNKTFPTCLTTKFNKMQETNNLPQTSPLQLNAVAIKQKRLDYETNRFIFRIRIK